MDAGDSKPERVVGRPFEPGKSGNPSGRHRVIREALEAFRNPEDLQKLRERLIDLALNGEPKVAMVAIREFHDRAYGKAPQAITNEDGSPLFSAGPQLLEAMKKLSGE